MAPRRPQDEALERFRAVAVQVDETAQVDRADFDRELVRDEGQVVSEQVCRDCDCDILEAVPSCKCVRVNGAMRGVKHEEQVQRLGGRRVEVGGDAVFDECVERGLDGVEVRVVVRTGPAVNGVDDDVEHRRRLHDCDRKGSVGKQSGQGIGGYAEEVLTMDVVDGLIGRGDC